MAPIKALVSSDKALIKLKHITPAKSTKHQSAQQSGAGSGQRFNANYTFLDKQNGIRVYFRWLAAPENVSSWANRKLHIVAGYCQLKPRYTYTIETARGSQAKLPKYVRLVQNNSNCPMRESGRGGGELPSFPLFNLPRVTAEDKSMSQRWLNGNQALLHGFVTTKSPDENV